MALSTLLPLALLLQLLHLCVSSAAPRSCRLAPTSASFAVGNATALVVSDGVVASSDNLFGVPRAAVEFSYGLLRRPTDPGVLGLNAVVLRLPADMNGTRSKTVLFDAGTGPLGARARKFERAGRLLQSLRAAGVQPGDVDAVVLSHGHFDHVGGILDARGRAAFPNATVYVPAVEHAFWAAEPFENRAGASLANATAAEFAAFYRTVVAPYLNASRLKTVQDGEQPLQGLTVRLVPGHAPGHAVTIAEVCGARLVITGDAWISRGDQVRHPEWGFYSEFNSSQALDSRLLLLKDLAASNDLVVSYHEPFPGVGYITNTAYGYDWIAAQRGLMDYVSGQCEKM